MTQPLHVRKSVRLDRKNYLGTRAYSVTICCDQKRPFFRDSERASRLIELLREVTSTQGFRVQAYCVMPDHFHFLAGGSTMDSNLIELVRVLKLRSSFEEMKKSGRKLWQRSYYEHILRPEDPPDGVAWYIWMNPVRRNLCREPVHYAFSGSFIMDWKQLYRPPAQWIPPWKQVRNEPDVGADL